MPELPEVETTRRGIEPHINGQKVLSVITRTKKLRWPIPSQLNKNLSQKVITSVNRRGKYLLLKTESGTLIIHLGMSGSLRVTETTASAQKHDHVDVVFKKNILRLHDPRRFGAVLWTNNNPLSHKLLVSLGPEPLDEDFTAKHIYEASRNRRISVKEFIMNSHVVVGVGNIYATEALFTSKIHPLRAAGKISFARYELLVTAIKVILSEAIQRGGTTLRDFTREDGKPGYFQQELKVYGRTKKPCVVCARPLRSTKQGQRTTTYCSQCQR
ncbi:MAG: bifunctional DNA-formamidopyrimidine glycosylase/DNA-(apurinic or apyrimidinic site) lyase [Gammaproteobacteria bacterium]|nr:bifunctional DNA-formamidopyrimidine glycosylase/DNA-(apurinic or apyrimidinic site) lyase [Gammaproteobacteria bacterium]